MNDGKKPLTRDDRDALGRVAYEGFPHPNQAEWESPYYTESEREQWRREAIAVVDAVCPPTHRIVPATDVLTPALRAAIGRAADHMEERRDAFVSEIVNSTGDSCAWDPDVVDEERWEAEAICEWNDRHPDFDADLAALRAAAEGAS